MKFRKNKKGFTIVELVIVIAVIGVLTAVLVPTFINLTQRANEASDQSLVKNLNTLVATKEQEPGYKKPNDPTGTFNSLKTLGYDGEVILKTQKSDKKILWNKKFNRFLFEENKGSAEFAGSKPEEFYDFVSTLPEQNPNGYSHYLFEEFEGEATVDSGLDVGINEDVTVINYRNTGTERDVNIRTNSESTTLTIDDASEGTIYHYGGAGALNIIKCHTDSYHENGKVGFAEIAKGRIVLEKGADVEEIHINKKTGASFDTVIIANNGGADELPDRITRDAVTVSEETLVVKVESNGSSENVYVYADGATGTKGSTQKITEGDNKQNENVNSALGQLVLDNGATADKAQTAEEKADAKDAAASEAVSADFEKDPANANYVARIGQTGYLTLDAAINAAKTSENPATVSLLKDIQTTSSFSITRSMAIKGSNHTITAAGTGSGYLFTVQDDNSTPSSMVINLSDLKINVTGRQCVVLVNNANDDFSHTFNISNTDITTDGEAVYSNGANVSNVTNCSIRHEGTYATGKEAVYYTALIVGYKGTLNATGCTITSFGNGVGAFPSGGTINLNDCEILASDDYVSENTGYSIYVWHQQHGYDDGGYKDYVGDSIINVYSGTYNGPLKYRFEPVANPNPSITYYNAQLNIYTGVFSHDPSEYVQSGHSAQQNQDGTWTVK